MNKKLKKIMFLALLISVFMAFSTAQVLAFWEEYLDKTVSSPLLAFVGSDYTFWNSPSIIEEGTEEQLGIISENFLVANHISTISGKKAFPAKTLWVIATAYSSTKDQTDSTPFITASGTHVRDGVIAANFLPIGSMIKIPEIFGNKTFIVEDRMNQRYGSSRIDIWFSERDMAKEFGIKKVKIEIIS